MRASPQRVSEVSPSLPSWIVAARQQVLIEDMGLEESPVARYSAEFIGTFFLVVSLLVAKNSRSKHGRTQKQANERKRVQMTAVRTRAQKSAEGRKRAQKSASA